jgi:predicted enzyme related to lactoylglutathione lyase
MDDPGGAATMILGLRTVIYRVSDLVRAKAWYRQAFEVEPYFDEPYYVGFQVGGFELGLDPDLSEGKPGAGGSVAYWGVDSIETTYDRFIELRAEPISAVRDVGGGIKVATVADPFGNMIGLIENPHFRQASG